MQRLIAMRHAKTEAWYEGVDDHGRALTERGHEDAARIAEAIAQEGWRADLALVSTARRARETWNAMRPLHKGAGVKLLDDLYLASPGILADLVEAHAGEGGSVILVGHNPGIHDFARDIARLGGGGDTQMLARLREKFPTGAAALFEAGEDGPFVPALFRLVELFRPKDLRDDPAAP